MKLMSSLDLVIAITTALQNWDGTPDQAASKLGEAIMAIRQYKIDNGWPVEIEEPAESAPAPREELPKASADCIESGTYRHYTPDELDEALPVGDLGEKPVTLTFGGPPTPYDWPDDSHLENGKYTCRCLDCGRFFVGHKRRLQCRVCAE